VPGIPDRDLRPSEPRLEAPNQDAHPPKNELLRLVGTDPPCLGYDGARDK
jgi:hypothetical protein